MKGTLKCCLVPHLRFRALLRLALPAVLLALGSVLLSPAHAQNQGLTVTFDVAPNLFGITNGQPGGSVSYTATFDNLTGQDITIVNGTANYTNVPTDTFGAPLISDFFNGPVQISTGTTTLTDIVTFTLDPALPAPATYNGNYTFNYYFGTAPNTTDGFSNAADFTINVTPSVAAVPEPAYAQMSVLLTGLGSVGLLARRRARS